MPLPFAESKDCMYHKLRNNRRWRRNKFLETKDAVKLLMLWWCLQANRVNRKRHHAALHPNPRVIKAPYTEPVMELMVERFPDPPSPEDLKWFLNDEGLDAAAVPEEGAELTAADMVAEVAAAAADADMGAEGDYATV